MNKKIPKLQTRGKVYLVKRKRGRPPGSKNAVKVFVPDNLDKDILAVQQHKFDVRKKIKDRIKQLNYMLRKLK